MQDNFHIFSALSFRHARAGCLLSWFRLKEVSNKEKLKEALFWQVMDPGGYLSMHII